MNPLKHSSSRSGTGAFVAISGLLLGGYMMSVTPALFLIPVRKILVALGGLLVVVGILVTKVDSLTPLTPARSLLVIGGVSVALLILLVYDLVRLGGNSLLVVFKPLQGFLVAAACGVPLGSAMKERQSTAGLLSLSGGVLVAVLTQSYFGVVPLLPVLAGVLFGSLSLLVGYTLTTRGA